jgi:type VI protein secretion system component Hcp
VKIDAYLWLVPSKGGQSGWLRGESADFVYSEKIAVASFDIVSAAEFDDVLNPTDESGKKISATYAPIGFKIDKEVDRASPFLFKAYVQLFSKLIKPESPPFSSAQVIFRKAGDSTPVEYMTMYFVNLVVTSFSLSCGEDGASKESVGFRFQGSAIAYTPQTAAGTAGSERGEKGWSFAKNSPQWQS